ncbi:MAG: hypothetical protein RQ856_03250 [Candidatus Izemoplasmatales bacterium]|nr:hypothetical protein [Candidatus Izemoplasmatales bacterium]
MKTLKKILVLFTFVLLIGSLTACSSINRIAKNFEEAGYTSYEYNFRGGSLLFSDIDDIIDDLNITVPVDTNVTTTENNVVITTQTTGTNTTVSTITTNPIASVLGFKAFAFSNGLDKVVIVIEFESEEKMQEVIDQSPTLQAILEGLDSADYTNGNCILIADESIYNEAVEIFQGNYVVPEEE